MKIIKYDEKQQNEHNMPQYPYISIIKNINYANESNNNNNIEPVTRRWQIMKSKILSRKTQFAYAEIIHHGVRHSGGRIPFVL